MINVKIGYNNAKSDSNYPGLVFTFPVSKIRNHRESEF